VKQFSWDEPRYPIKTPVPELIKIIQDSVQRMDEELKVKQMDYSLIRSALATVARKKDGNLANKSLVGIVLKHHVVASNHLDTVFCAVPKSGLQEFMQNYESWGKVPAAEHPKETKRSFLLHKIEELDKESSNYESEKQRLMVRQLELQTNAVVPGSAGDKNHPDPIAEDSEYCLFPVVIFKTARQSFEQDANQKSSVRIIVRDFTYHDEQDKTEANDARKLELDERSAQEKLKKWAETTYSESFTAWMHLKCIRAFVESVLRYGLPPRVSYSLIKPGRQDEKVRKALNMLYVHLLDKDKKDMISKPEEGGAGTSFYPYVDLEIKYTCDDHA